jgi:hypothetical protein
MKKILPLLSLILILFSSCDRIKDEFQDIKIQRKERIRTVMKQLARESQKPFKTKAQIVEEISKQFKKIEMSK